MRLYLRALFRPAVVLAVLVAIWLPSVAAAQSLTRVAPESAGLSSAKLAEIVPALRTRFVDSAQAPGFVVMVARHGKIAFVDSVGFADVERRVPMRSTTVFRIYSMTKPIATVAAMQLIEQGKLGLDDPVSRYIPALAQPTVRTAAASPASPATRPITIRQLLTHTAGLPYPRGLLARSASLATFIDTLAKIPLAYQPGERWQYSVAPDVLGRVVELISGKTLDAYFRDAIFAPLGMPETGFHVMPGMDGRIAVDYSRINGGPITAPPDLLDPQYQPTSQLFMASEGLLSTPRDYLRFAQALLNGGELDGKRILRRETVAAMMTNQVPANFSQYVAKVVPDWILAGEYGFGFGGAVRVDAATTPSNGKGTFLWAGAHATFFSVDPTNDMVVTLWTQCSGTCSKERFEKVVQAGVYAALIHPER